jgi:cell division protease FtsH
MADAPKSSFALGAKKPELEINKPVGKKFWQQPGNLWWIYIITMLGSLWFWEGAQQVASEQIPYSEFLQHLDKSEVKEATLNDQIISGTLTETDPKTHQPRQFITQRPEEDALAQSLAQHGRQVNFLINWVLPFGAMILLWNWYSRRMGNRGLLNLGALVHFDLCP